MKQGTPKFSVDVILVDEINNVPDSWTTVEYKQVLEACEFDGFEEVPDNELQDYVIISLLDMEPIEAAEIILKVKIGGRLKVGQFKSLAQEMQEEKLWEEYADLSLHEKLYHCAVLLHQTFPKNFPETEAIKCVLEITAENSHANQAMEYLEETLLVRIIADGMDDHAILKRLFSEQLAKNFFTEAEHIIWQYETLRMVDNRVRVILYSSEYWLKSLNNLSHYESSAFSDTQLVKV